MNKPDEADEIMVFMTIWLADLSSFEIFIDAPAFMKSEQKRMTKVPATNSETFEAK